MSAVTNDTQGRVGGTALLLLGGGARAAYSVGLLRCLARRLPERYDFTVIAGVSSGAINAAFLASRPGTFRERVAALADLWQGLEPSSVMDVRTVDLLKKILGWGAGLVGGGSAWMPTPRALVDCRPLQGLLRRELGDSGDTIPGIQARLDGGPLRSVLLATTSYTTGESVIWSQGVPIPEEWARSGRRSESADLTVSHVMASASLPLLFPAVQLDDEWHGDGEVRLDSPLSPLIALGVDRILVVSTHHAQARARPEGFARGYPPPGQVAGTVVNAAFLHHLSTDERRLRRVNHLVDRCGDDPPGSDDDRSDDDGLDGLSDDDRHFRRVGLYVLRPSSDLEALAGQREPALPTPLRWMIRGLGTHSTASPGLLSLISFQPDYLRELIQQGEADAEAQSEAIRSFIQGEDVDVPQASTHVDELRLR